MVKPYKIFASFDDCIMAVITSDHDHTEYELVGRFKKNEYVNCPFDQFIAKSDDINELLIWADLHGLDVKKDCIQ